MKSKSFQIQLLLSVLYFGAITHVTNASRVIFLLPIATRYDKVVFDPLIKAVALRDHDVTVVSPVPSKGLPASVKEIHPVPVDVLGYEVNPSGKDLLQTREKQKLSYFPVLLWNTSAVEFSCHQLYKDVEIKYLMRGLKRFDLAIVNGLQNECALGLVNHLRVPHIYLSTMPPPNHVIGRFGNYFPTSFVPSPYTLLDARMSFGDRTVNFIVETGLVFFTKYYLYPQYEAIYKAYVGEETPGIDEIEDNAGVILMNTNYVFSHSRPLLPNLIEVGGLHCRPPRPLPIELDKFLKEAKDGFIYVSLGSTVQSQDLPTELQDLFLKVFANVDEKVVWKWDAENLTLPPNVMMNAWFPQQDILGHKNIKLFISTGTHLSTQEAIYHGVPILGIPLSGEHDWNMIHAEKAGFAKTWGILRTHNT